MMNVTRHNYPSPIQCLRVFRTGPCYVTLTLVLLLLCLYCCHCCYYYRCYCCYHYFATDTLLQILSLSGVVELTTQLLILENILWLPLVSNQQIWVEYSTLENCCDPLYLWVIKTIFWRRCRGSTTIFSESLGIYVC